MSKKTNPAIMPRGLTTVAYMAADHKAAKKWYAELVGVGPYMDKPGYAEFRFGDYQHELGIIDAAFIGELGDGQVSKEPGGAIVYWAVDDVEGALQRLLDMGAALFQPPRDFGSGFIGASVVDPFGNIFGIMYNPHYLDILAKTRPEMEK